MGHSKEYHLTPRGWVMGTIKEDFSPTDYVEPPEDRVLTMKCHEVIKDFNAYDIKGSVEHYDEIVCETVDIKKLNELKEKYGEKPD